MTEREEFCCPTFIPAGTDENDFCIPDECFAFHNRQPKFPSPTDCLPILEQIELEESIAETNQFLLDLALDERYTNRQIWERVLGSFAGKKVTLFLDAEFPSEVYGVIKLAGFDFALVRNKKSEKIIPYENIIRIVADSGYHESVHEPELLHIDPCFRRELTFCFGRTVASSPELIQLFFGLPLSAYLLSYLDHKVVVLVRGKHFEGTLCDVTQENLTIDDHGKEVSILFNQIIVMSVLK